MTKIVSNKFLVEILSDTHTRTMELIAGLNRDQLFGPCLPIVNPLLWEIGHVAWFYERFILRKLYDRVPFLDRGDALYDSIAISHETRWDLDILELDECLGYIHRIREDLIERLGGQMASEQDSFIYQFAVFHQDMHNEAYTYSRQTLAYPKPGFGSVTDYYQDTENVGPLPGDVEIEGGTFNLGSTPDAAFLFDNEKWSHPVTVKPFRIARAPVTNIEYAAFVDDGGYRRKDLWTDAGWAWRQQAGAEHPVYWVQDSAGNWYQRHFESTVLMAPDCPVAHINWHEACAWCNWAGRRLPTELEWEVAAATEPDANNGIAVTPKRSFPWGTFNSLHSPANLDGRTTGLVDVAAYPEGDSAWGCRQMLGNVWEWTASVFIPYPGFAPDTYREYSEPMFGNTMVLRGGAWPTRSRMITTTYRNFFPPERRDIIAGFRSCACRRN